METRSRVPAIRPFTADWGTPIEKSETSSGMAVIGSQFDTTVSGSATGICVASNRRAHQEATSADWIAPFGTPSRSRTSKTRASAGAQPVVKSIAFLRAMLALKSENGTSSIRTGRTKRSTLSERSTMTARLISSFTPPSEALHSRPRE